jgi:hypothetical protein
LAAPQAAGGQELQTIHNMGGSPTHPQQQAVAIRLAQVLADVGDVQPMHFSAITQLQQSCPDILQIISQAVGRVPLLGDVSTGVLPAGVQIDA